MPRDDREQNFDKALARHLGSAGTPQGNDCLDAETLAAYHDRLLDPEEMALRKSHIASCERCQEILAQLEATDAIPVEADRDLLLDQIVLEIPESESAPAGAAATAEPPLESEAKPEPEEVALPMAAAPLAAPQAETPAAPEPKSAPEFEIEHDPDLVAASAAPLSRAQSEAPGLVSAAAAPKSTLGATSAVATKSAPPSSATITFRSPRQEGPKLVRFVALAGALAAGLIFWLVYRNQNESVNIAQNHQQKLEMPPQSPAPPPPADEKAAASASQSSEPNAALAKQESSAAAPSAQPERDKSKAPAESLDNSLDDAKKTLDSAKAIEQKSRKDASGAASTFIPRRDESVALSSNAARAVHTVAPAGPRAAGNLSPVDKALADAKAALQGSSNSPSSIPATPPPARTKMNPGVVTDSTSIAAAPSVGLAPVSASGDALSKPATNRVIAALTPLSVPAPSGKIIWRIGQAGQIQRSSDAGATWSIQPSGVVSDLIAGSAYSDQVCWLVGRNGTILRTTDGGATWQKVASPSNVDLLGVFSINADSATITDAAGRAFETTSAGSHWTRTRLQQ